MLIIKKTDNTEMQEDKEESVRVVNEEGEK